MRAVCRYVGAVAVMDDNDDLDVDDEALVREWMADHDRQPLQEQPTQEWWQRLVQTDDDRQDQGRALD